jgi:uncharacterized protein YcbK (DUF882 family)
MFQVLRRAFRRARVSSSLAVLFAALVPVLATSSAAEASCLPSSLKRTLSQIERQFGSVSIVSTHRPGARIAGSGRPSLHASCRAVDFNPPRGKHAQVVAWLKANHSGGVGTYSCGMNHVHIDNGPYVRYHRCQTASGKILSGSRMASASSGKRGARLAAAAPKGKPLSFTRYAMMQ